MLLRHNNLTIRNAAVDDAEQLALWWNDGAVMAHAGFPLGIGRTPEEIAEDLKSDSDEIRRRLMIEIDGAAAGEMFFRNQGGRTVEIGIKICDASRQNQGFGKVLLSMLISHLFTDLGYQKIALDTDLENKRAQHVYERLGFTKLRVNKNAWINQVGESRSSVEYELYQENFINYAN